MNGFFECVKIKISTSGQIQAIVNYARNKYTNKTQVLKYINERFDELNISVDLRKVWIEAVNEFEL